MTVWRKMEKIDMETTGLNEYRPPQDRSRWGKRHSVEELRYKATSLGSSPLLNISVGGLVGYGTRL